MGLVQQVNGWIILAVGLVGGVVALYHYGKKAVRVYRNLTTKAGHLYDSLAGFDELVDPVTGVVVRPALPGISMRVAVIEQWQAQAISTLERVATVLENQQSQETRLTAITARQDEHEAWSHQWIADHESKFSRYHAETVQAIEDLRTLIETSQSS